MVMVHDLASGQLVSGVPARFLAHSPRFSPDGEQVYCFGNGRIYRHSTADGTTETVVDIAGSHASFHALSPDAEALAFSAYKVPVDPENHPPSVFLLDLASGKMEQVAPDRQHPADRFPQWSLDSRSLAFERRRHGPEGMSTVGVLTDRAGLATRELRKEPGWSQKIGRHCWSTTARMSSQRSRSKAATADWRRTVSTPATVHGRSRRRD